MAGLAVIKPGHQPKDHTEKEKTVFDLELTIDATMPSGHLYLVLATDGKTLRVTAPANWQAGDAKLLLALQDSLAELIADAVADAPAPSSD